MAQEAIQQRRRERAVVIENPRPVLEWATGCGDDVWRSLREKRLAACRLRRL